MKFPRMPIEEESPEQLGYDREWVAPSGGCVCFPRVRDGAGFDAARFYRALNEDHAAYVGPGHWFEMPDRHFRVGYGWPTPEELAGGLEAISAALRA